MDTSGSSTTPDTQKKKENKRKIPELPHQLPYDGSMDEPSNGFPNEFAENDRSTSKRKSSNRHRRPDLHPVKTPQPPDPDPQPVVKSPQPRKRGRHFP